MRRIDWIVILLGGALAHGCLYLDDIGQPIEENSPPYFYNWIPAATTVEIGPSGETFYAYYTDPDEDDIERLEMQWYLDGREQGNGNQIKIWMEDLGTEGTAVLVAHVADPQEAQDSLLWKLEVQPQVPNGD